MTYERTKPLLAAAGVVVAVVLLIFVIHAFVSGVVNDHADRRNHMADQMVLGACGQGALRRFNRAFPDRDYDYLRFDSAQKWAARCADR